MDPRDFLDVALLLSGEAKDAPGEAKYRSAVGRAYYALHNVVTQVLAEIGFNLRRDPSGHAKASRYLVNSKLPDAIQVGKILESLRDERNEADYNMTAPGFEQRAAVSACLRAKTAVDALARVNLQDLKSAITEYLRQIGELK